MSVEICVNSNSENLPTHVDGFSLLGVKCSYLREFTALCNDVDALRDKTTSQVNESFLQPYTRDSGLSLCDQLKQQGRTDVVGRATWFISHAWNYRFLDVVEAINIFLEKECGSIQAADDTIIWFDLFSNSQHNCAAREFEWWEGTFRTAIKLLGNVLMIALPWDNPLSLTRAWCVFEVFACESTGSRFEVTMTEAESLRMFQSLSDSLHPNVIEKYYQMLTNIHTVRSEAWKDPDRAAIHGAIENLVGFTRLDSMVLRAMETWMISTLRRRLAVSVDEVSCAVFEEEGVLTLLGSLVELHLQQGNLRAAQILGFQWVEVAKAQFYYYYQNDVSVRLHNYIRSLKLTAITLLRMNNLEAAGKRFEKCLTIMELFLGTDHALFISTSAYHAQLLHKKGQYDLAVDVLLRCIKQCRNRSEQWNFTRGLATFFIDREKYDAALPLLLQCKEEAYLPSDHPTMLDLLNHLGTSYFGLDMLTDAQAVLTECLDRYRRTLGPEHLDTLNCMNSLASVFQRQNNLNEVRVLRTECLDALMKKFGPEHPDTIIAYNNLATIYELQGDDARAEEMFSECFGRFMVALGAQNPTTMMSLKLLADAQLRQSKFSLAQASYEEYLSMSVAREEGATLDVKDVLLKLSYAHGMQHNYQAALDISLELLYVVSIVCRDHDLLKSTLTVTFSIIGLLRKLGRNSEADELHKDTLSRMKQHESSVLTT